MRNFLANNVVDKACSQHIFSDKTLLFQGRLFKEVFRVLKPAGEEL